MLILVATLLIGLALSYVYLKDREINPRLSEVHSAVPVVGVQIICGNCAGDAGFPRKTYVDKSGCCSECGSHSYILAAKRPGYYTSLMAERATTPVSAASDQNEWGTASAMSGVA